MPVSLEKRLIAAMMFLQALVHLCLRESARAMIAVFLPQGLMLTWRLNLSASQ